MSAQLALPFALREQSTFDRFVSIVVVQESPTTYWPVGLPRCIASGGRAPDRTGNGTNGSSS